MSQQTSNPVKSFTSWFYVSYNFVFFDAHYSFFEMLWGFSVSQKLPIFDMKYSKELVPTSGKNGKKSNLTKFQLSEKDIFIAEK